MNAKVQFSSKKINYLLKAILAVILSLLIGAGKIGHPLQASAEGLASVATQNTLGSLVDQVDTFPGLLISTIPFDDIVDITGASSDTNDIPDPDPIVLGDCTSTKGDASVWYNYQPATDAYLYIDTIGSNYDTLIAVWTGVQGSLNLVACGDDISTYPPINLQSKVGFAAQAGTKYYIEIIRYSQPAPTLPQAQATIVETLYLHIESKNGSDTTGVFRPSNGLLYLKNSNTTGFADIAINYGTGGDYPVTGDWDGNGTDTIGIYRNGYFYLRNSNTIGFADIVFPFGVPGDQPIAGDWDGDGIDTIGVYRPWTGQFLLRNSNTSGAEEMSFYLGNIGDVGIAGDWDGDGIDTTGVFRPSNGVIFLKNENSTGFADIALNYGLPGDMPVTGDWDGNGTDTIGIYRNGVFYLRNSNTIGFADIVFGLGNPGDMPIAGNWDGIP